MRILVLYDGKAGHLSQALGVAQLIQYRLKSPVTIDQRIAKIRTKILNPVVRKLAIIPASPLINSVISNYRWHPPEQKPDLIISFGGNVLALNIALSKLWKCNNAAIGNLYSIPRKHIDVHVRMFGDATEPGVIATPVALCKIDLQACRTKGAEFKLGSPDTNFWAMLVGGDGSGYRYQASDWHNLGASMRKLSYRYGIKWLLTTSRRSGVEAEIILKQYLDSSFCAKTVFGSRDKSNLLEAFLGASEQIFCTEDSLSMVTESVAMGKPVKTLVPEHVTYKRTHNNAIGHLEACGLIQRIEIEKLEHFSQEPYIVKKSYSAHLDDIYSQLAGLLSGLDREEPRSSSMRYIQSWNQ